MFRTSAVPRSATLWMIKRPAFLLGAAMEAVEPEAPVLLVWHPEKVKQASATMSKPQIWYLYLFMPSSDKPLCIKFCFIFLFSVVIWFKPSALTALWH